MKHTNSKKTVERSQKVIAPVLFIDNNFLPFLYGSPFPWILRNFKWNTNLFIHYIHIELLLFTSKTYNCLAANAKFCTSPLNFSTCGNARFQLIKLCNRNKSRRITTNLVKSSQSTSISSIKKLQELLSMEINVFNAILCVLIFLGS